MAKVSEIVTRALVAFQSLLSNALLVVVIILLLLILFFTPGLIQSLFRSGDITLLKISSTLLKIFDTLISYKPLVVLIASLLTIILTGAQKRGVQSQPLVGKRVRSSRKRVPASGSFDL